MENLGKLGRDKVTGFEGIITAKTRHLCGCDSYYLTPKAKDGETKESRGFDAGRIEIIGEGISPESVQTEKKGGENLSAPDNIH